MLLVSVLTGVILFILVITVMDHVLGEVKRPGETSEAIRRVRGEKATPQQKVSLRERLRPKSKRESLHMGVLAIVIFLSVYVFLKNIPLAILFSSSSLLYPRYREREGKKKRREQLNVQFRDAMLSVANSLRAGNSLQVSIERALEDLQRIYRHQRSCPMVEEWHTLVAELNMGQDMEMVLVDFREQMNMEDVDTFVNSTLIIMRKGGNMTEVLSNVAQTIGDRIEVKRDIMTLTAGKRSEARMLTLMPLGLVGLLMLLSPDYLAPMYDKPLGKILAAVGLLLLAANYFIGKKIIDIDI